jgi:hypothetical protein
MAPNEQIRDLQARAWADPWLSQDDHKSPPVIHLDSSWAVGLSVNR